MNISQKLEAIAEALDKIGGVMTQIKNEWDDKESPHELENARELLAEVADVVEGEAWRYRSQTQSYPPDEPEYCLVCGKQELHLRGVCEFTLTEAQAMSVIREYLRNSHDWFGTTAERWFSVERIWRETNRQRQILYRVNVKMEQADEVRQFLKRKRYPEFVHQDIFWHADNLNVSVGAVGDKFEAQIHAGFGDTLLAVSYSAPNGATLDFYDHDDMQHIKAAIQAAWDQIEPKPLEYMLPDLLALCKAANKAYNDRLQDVCIREPEARGDRR